MDAAAPIIFANIANGEQPQSLSLRGRLAALVVSMTCLAPLVLAAMLTPSPTGTGTHTEIGLSQCQFMARTGLPCPSCGMTTSWTWFVRGNLMASLYVQPMGTVLAVLAVCCFWAGGYAAATGRPVYRLLNLVPGRYYFVPLLMFAIAAWGWKIGIHLTGRDGW